MAPSALSKRVTHSLSTATRVVRFRLPFLLLLLVWSGFAAAVVLPEDAASAQSPSVKLASANITSTHEQGVRERLALELFFHDDETNWYKSQWEDKLVKWAEGNNDAFTSARESRPNLSVARFFAESVLGWEDEDTEPTLDAVKERFRRDRHKARRVNFALKALRSEEMEAILLPILLQGAKSKADLDCWAFASIFSHEATTGEEHMCLADILNMVNTILVQTLSVTAKLMRFKGGVSNKPPKGGLNGYNPKLETSQVTALTNAQTVAVQATAKTVLELMRIVTWGQILTGVIPGLLTTHVWTFVENSLNSTYEHIEQTLATGHKGSWDVRFTDFDHPTWGAFAMAEYISGGHDNNTSRNPSIYDYDRVNGNIFFRRYTEASNDSSTSNDIDRALSEPQSDSKVESTSSMRITKLFGIRKFVGDGGEYHLEDNLFGNVILHMVNEDKSPMDIDVALDFLTRHGLWISERVRQLQSTEVDLSPEYMRSLVPRSEFRHPKISIIPSAQYMPWAEAFGGFTYEGIGNHPDENSGSTNALRWAAGPKYSELENESENSSRDIRRQIRHEISGDVDAFDALGLPVPAERHLEHNHNDDGDDVYFVHIQDHLFKDEIVYPQDNGMCGVGHYTGHNEHEKACHQFLNDTVDTVTRRLSSRHSAADSNPSSMAAHLSKRFSTYTAWMNVKQLDDRSFRAISAELPSLKDVQKHLVQHNWDIEDKTYKNLKNSLVSKVYADGSCLVQCFPQGTNEGFFDNKKWLREKVDDVWCIAGCYNPIESVLEPLYGFKEDHSWERERVRHYAKYYCGESRIRTKRRWDQKRDESDDSENEIPCSREGNHNHCCPKKPSRKTIGGFQAHFTTDSTLGPYYQNFTYENTMPGTSVNPYYKNQKVFGWHRCDPDMCQTAMDDEKRVSKARGGTPYGWSREVAGQEPFNLDEAKIIRTSWQANKIGDKSIYVPGLVTLNPYTNSIKDITPTLPVCYSKIDLWKVGYRGIPCNCGNMYGDETALVANAASGAWRSHNWEDAYRDVEYCLDVMEPMAYDHPAAFLLNMCNAYFIVSAPANQEEWNRCYYKENQAACTIYLDYYKNNKHLDDNTLNHEICKLWKQHSRGWDRGIRHGEKDFCYVNDLLEDRGCHAYASDSEQPDDFTHSTDECKVTDSSDVSSSDCGA